VLQGCPTLSGSVVRSMRTSSIEPNLEALNLRMMSWRVAATTKYSCFNLSSLPSKNYKKTGTESFKTTCVFKTRIVLNRIVDPD